MIRFILIRLLQAIPVLFIIATITFFMVRLAPGGPFTEEKTIPVEIRKKMEEHYGLDRPLWEQYLLYFGIISKEVDKHRLEFAGDKDAAEFSPEGKNFTVTATRGSVLTTTGQSPGQWHSRVVPETERVSENHEVLVFRRERSGLLFGELGPSFKYIGWDVEDLIRRSFPVSMQLGLCALAIALCIGLPAGIIAALKKNSLLDYVPMSTAMLGICLPTFVMGPLLILIFSSSLGWFSPIGWYTWGDMVLPSLTLGLYYAAYVARLTRGGMLEVLNQDFIRTARAKGASETRVILKHSLRGGLLPVVSFLGPAFAGLISGSFVIETIFSIPGLGKFFVTAAFNRDYTMVIGTVLFYAALIILMNLLVDILQAWLNPRTRLES
ncbi:ABC transporter permease subunit [Verrucomicrobia bacterium]|nr:ABC transporter permease subunit [Verrucomicrobiota bacterium]